MEMGRSRRRTEDERFLTGRGRYTDDHVPQGALHGLLVRSPHAHADFTVADLAAARAAPGVAAVLTAADLAGLGPLPCIAVPATEAPLPQTPRPALAAGRVRHVGDPVAFVVAETVNAARDAAELVTVDYESLPAVVDAAAALAPGAPLLWPGVPGNRAFRFLKGDHAAVQAGLAAAAHVVELAVLNNRVVAAPLEPRSALAQYSEPDGFDLVVSAGGVHTLRDVLADRVFGVPRARMRVMAPDVGGGFGPTNSLYPEYVLVLEAARRLGRPVLWVSERAEDFLTTAPGRDNLTTGRLGLDAQGRFLALEVTTLADMGAYLATTGPGSSTTASGTATGGLSAIPAASMEVTGLFTNTVPIDAYRGAGKPEANYLIERLADAAAARLGLGADEIRRRNLMRPPYRTAMGMAVDDGRPHANLEQVLARAGFADAEARRAAARARGTLFGVGVACFMETSRGAPGEGAGFRFRADGRVDLLVGTQSNGQGHETSFPQVAADLLGMDRAVFDLVQADTQLVPSGNGHGGARSLVQGGAAIVLAAERLIEAGKEVAARLLQARIEEVRFAAGQYAAGERSVRMMEVGREGALAVWETHGNDTFTFPNGAHVAEVEVDPETGAVRLLRYLAVDDYGRLVNPLLTEGQVQGGLAQGIGQALTERVAYDADGQLLSGTFMDYALPRAEDLPWLEVAFEEVPTQANALGVKGSGQAGCIGAPQAVMNAVNDALRQAGGAFLDMPATPERVWRALRP